MSIELIGTLLGLALLDALNTSTLFIVIVILLTARRPERSAAAYLVGAALSFLGLAVGLYLGASAASAVVEDLARWLRRMTFALLAVWLFWLAVRRLRDRPRKPFLLPAWFGPLTAGPIGAVATLADLPNAFPLFLAIERLLTASLAHPPALAALAAYTVIYALPIVAVIVVAGGRRVRARERLRRITDRFLTGVARRSLPLVAGFSAGGVASATAAVAL